MLSISVDIDVDVDVMLDRLGGIGWDWMGLHGVGLVCWYYVLSTL